MDKQFYKSKKFWTAVVTSVAAIVLYITAKHELAELITFVGAVLIAGFGMADLGKEAKLPPGGP